MVVNEGRWEDALNSRDLSWTDTLPSTRSHQLTDQEGSCWHPLSFFSVIPYPSSDGALQFTTDTLNLFSAYSSSLWNSYTLATSKEKKKPTLLQGNSFYTLPLHWVSSLGKMVQHLQLQEPNPIFCCLRGCKRSIYPGVTTRLCLQTGEDVHLQDYSFSYQEAAADQAWSTPRMTRSSSWFWGHLMLLSPISRTQQAGASAHELLCSHLWAQDSGQTIFTMSFILSASAFTALVFLKWHQSENSGIRIQFQI